MESIRNSNTSEGESKKMTLKDYYQSLPVLKRIAPRQDLVNRIMEKCGVTESTVRNWLQYGMKPQKKEYIEVLQEETGIAPEDMWEN